LTDFTLGMVSKFLVAAVPLYVVCLCLFSNNGVR